MATKITNKKLKEMVTTIYANKYDRNICNEFPEYAYPYNWVDRTNEQEQLYSTLCDISRKVSKELNLDYIMGGLVLYASINKMMHE